MNRIRSLATRLLPTGVLAVVLLAGCARLGLGESEPISVMPLTDTRWVSEEIYGRRTGPVAGLGFRLRNYEGAGPCNRFSGTWFADGGRIVFGQPTSTKRGCPGMDVEKALFSALAETVHHDVVRESLILMDGDGEVLAVFRRSR